MIERLPENQRTLISIAALTTAAIANVAAIEYADDTRQKPTVEQLDQSSTTEAVHPQPTISPTSLHSLGSTAILFPAESQAATPTITANKAPQAYNLESKAEKPLKKLPIEKLRTIPENVRSIMSANTVYTPLTGCSGFLVRNDRQKPIGALSATHCGLGEYTLSPFSRLKLTNGDQYLVSNQPFKALSGASAKTFKPAGQFNQFIIAKNEFETDIALGSFEGESVDKVHETYNKNRLTPVEIDSLVVGKQIVYQAGFPAEQPKNNGSFSRQEFAGVVVSRSYDTKSMWLNSGDNVLWTAMPPNKSDASCTPGNSGSQGFIMQNGKARSVGTAHWYFDLDAVFHTDEVTKKTTRFRTLFERELGYDLTGFTTLCGYSFDSPRPGIGSKKLTLADSFDAIPGYAEQYSPEAQLAKVRAEFYDPKTPRHIIDGVVMTEKVTPGAIKGGPVAQLVNKPAIFYDKLNNGAVLAWFDLNEPNNLALEYKSELSEILIYDSDTVEGVDVTEVSGEVIPVSSQEDDSPDSFKQNDSSAFGTLLSNREDNFIGEVYGLYYGSYKDTGEDFQLRAFKHGVKGGVKGGIVDGK